MSEWSTELHLYQACLNTVSHDELAMAATTHPQSILRSGNMYRAHLKNGHAWQSHGANATVASPHLPFRELREIAPPG